MSETNDFDLFIGLILARLYEARPKRLDLEASDFIGELDNCDSNDIDRSGNWCNTMFWLKTEGYIRDKGVFTGDTSYQFQRTELTEKGFRALNSLPSHLGSKPDGKPFGSQLTDFGKKVGFKAASKIAEKGADETYRQTTHAIGELIKNFFNT